MDSADRIPTRHTADPLSHGRNHEDVCLGELASGREAACCRQRDKRFSCRSYQTPNQKLLRVSREIRSANPALEHFLAAADDRFCGIFDRRFAPA